MKSKKNRGFVKTIDRREIGLMKRGVGGERSLERIQEFKVDIYLKMSTIRVVNGEKCYNGTAFS